MAFTLPIHSLGFTVSGDVGPYTCYTDRFGKKVFYPKSPPKSPPSDLQLHSRMRFTSAQAQYMALSETDKAAWELLVQRANLCLTGQNLFIHVAMMHTYNMLLTLIGQTDVSVDPPDPV